MKLKTPKLPRKGHHEVAAGVAAAPAPAPVVPAPATSARSLNAPVAPASPLKKVTGGLAAPVRRRNTAAMIAGLAFILIAAAMAASVASSFDDSIDVLVASEPIAEGQPVTEDHFRSVKIAAGTGDIQAVSPDSLTGLVGLIAAGPIGEGSLIHPAQFVTGTEEEQIVVGAALEPNQYPANGLKPGDQVRVIAVSDAFGFSEFTTGEEITVGEVTFVQVLNNNNDIHVSVRVGESSANVVAELVSQNRISLGLVDQSISIDSVDPLQPAQAVQPLALDSEPTE